MVIVYKAPVSLTSEFKTSYPPNLERADFDGESFPYTWLNSYFFSSLRESKKTEYPELLGTTRWLRYSKKFVTTAACNPPVLSLVLYPTLVWRSYRYPIDSRHHHGGGYNSIGMKFPKHNQSP